MQSLEWLNDCLVTRSLFLNGNREKTWSSYQQGLEMNIDSMTAAIKCRHAAAFLALQVMKELVLLNYTEPTPKKPDSPIDISETEEQIIAYISGYILRKLNKSVEAQALMSDKVSGLTAVLNRGGLTQAKESFVTIVHELEVAFRHLPEMSVDSISFETIVCGQNIHSQFFEILESVDSSAEEKEHFFMKVLRLFFTVRAYQKCRHEIEKCIKTTKKPRKSKALRDSI